MQRARAGDSEELAVGAGDATAAESAFEKGDPNVWIVPVIVVVVVAVGLVVANAVMRRKGYSIPGRTVVRCSKGHRFVTTWIEGGSLKAVRLGPVTRYQRCPVGDHWAIVHPVKDADLTEEDRQLLAESR